MGVQVACFGDGVGQTSMPEGIPSNVTGILVSNFNIASLDFNQFYNYEQLTDLVIKNSNISEITVTKVLKNIRSLSLQGNHLEALPRRALGRLKRLEQLSLRENQITSLRNIRFPRKLDILDLRSNKLTSLTGGLFRNTKTLRVIKLNDNEIKDIHLNAFVNTPNIEVLDLENNSMEKLTRGMFSKLASSWYINLRGNNIKSIHKFAFLLFGSRSHVRNQIDLRDNQIRFLSVEVLQPLLDRRDAYEVNFAGNPVFCDCNLLNLREEAGAMFTDTGHTVCDGPPDNQGRLVLRLKFEDCCF